MLYVANMILDITSTQNNLIKMARGLDRKKERNQSGLFRAEGARHVKEGLDLGWKLDTLLFSSNVESRPHISQLIEMAAKGGAKIARVNDRLLETITHRDNAQSVVGLFHQKWSSLEEFREAKTIVALERIKDPGNLGTIIRTLDSIGSDAIILLEECCDPYSVEAIRAAMGSSFCVRIAKSSIEDFLVWKKDSGRKLFGTYLKGSELHTETQMTTNCILLMGNEQSGIDENLAQKCDGLIKLPMAGRADSLNLAIATGICLYEIWRQNGFDGKI